MEADVKASGLLRTRQDADGLEFASTLLLIISVAWGGSLIWLTPHPPLNDFPQHAGQVALLLDHFGRDPIWSDSVTLNPLTPYWIAYGASLPLAWFLGPTAALKAVVSLAYFGTVFLTTRLFRILGVNRHLIWITLPAFFGFAYCWGFITYVVAVPLGLLFLIASIRQDERATPLRASALVIAGIVLYFSHLIVFAHIVAVAATMSVARRFGKEPLRSILAPHAALMLIAATIFSVGRSIDDGIAPLGGSFYGSITRRIAGLLVFPLGTYPELWVAIATAALVLAPFVAGFRLRRTEYWRHVPLLSMLAIWLVVPMQVGGISSIYDRTAIFLLPFMMLSIERRVAGPRDRLGQGNNVVAAAVVAATLLGYFGWRTTQAVRFAHEEQDFRSLVQRLPAGERALNLVFESGSPAMNGRKSYMHWALWYQAEHRGFVDFNFAWFLPQALRFRPTSLPKVSPDEWDPGAFDWSKHEGWRYGLFFMRGAGSGGKLPPSPSGKDCRLVLLDEQGSWRVYGARGCAAP